MSAVFDNTFTQAWALALEDICILKPVNGSGSRLGKEKMTHVVYNI
jgi:hypothetical protein